MKVLIEDGIAIASHSGIGRYTQNLVRELGRLEDVEVVQSPPGAAIKKTRPRTLRRLLYYVWLETRFQARLSEAAPDIAHFTNYLVPSVRKAKAKYVATIHDLAAWKCPWTLPSGYARYLRWAIGRAVKTADLILTPSDFVNRQVVELFRLSQDKVKTVYNGATTFSAPSIGIETPYIEQTRRRFGLDRPFLLFAGTLEERKNIPTLLRAFARLATSLDLQLVLVGRPGYGFERIQKCLREPPFPRRCIVTGFIPDDELAALYRLAEAFVFPSQYEGFGIPLLEAMESGTPVVASRIPSAVEVAGEAALYYDDPFDDQALGERITEVLTSPSLRADLASRGKTRAADFAWEKLARKYVDTYRGVLGTP